MPPYVRVHRHGFTQSIPPAQSIHGRCVHVCVHVRWCVYGQVLYMWSGEHGRRPYGLNSDEQARLVELKNAFLKKHSLRDNFLTDDFLLCVLRARACVSVAVCACGQRLSESPARAVFSGRRRERRERS